MTKTKSGAIIKVDKGKGKSSTNIKKTFKKTFIKSIDKNKKRCYNKGTKIRKEAQGAKGIKIMKKFNIEESIIAEFGEDFTIISKESKKGEQLKEHAECFDDYSLYNVYDRPSYRKEKAWEYCKNLCRKYNGTNLHIVGHNTCTFSVSFNIGDKVAYITASNNYLIA